jgi:hypothetical protein
MIFLVVVPLLLSLSGRLSFERGQFSCHDTTIQLKYRKSVGSMEKILTETPFFPEF